MGAFAIMVILVFEVTFAIMHYAGKVDYDLQGVLNKNKDSLPNSVRFTMKSKSLSLSSMITHV